jgi:hypothetical protein
MSNVWVQDPNKQPDTDCAVCGYEEEEECTQCHGDIHEMFEADEEASFDFEIELGKPVCEGCWEGWQ